MVYPEFLKIGAHEYKLIFASHWLGSDEGDLGQTFYDRGEIYIRSGLPDTVTFSTLMHEILHVINPQLDHVFLEGLAEQMSQVLLDNELIDEG